MALILTFLGKGGTGRTTTAIALGKKLAQMGQRVLLLGQDASVGLVLGAPLTENPQELGPNFYGLQLSFTHLLERGWEQIKELESQYLRSPTLKNIYGQELGILPGMDEVLTLNALRDYQQGGRYDVILYDGPGNLNTLRMLGVPEIASWYWRRFRQVLEGSEVVQTVSPFLQPIAGALLNVSWNLEQWGQTPATLLQDGQAMLSRPDRFAAYLVTTNQPPSIAVAQSLWGGAQQVGLTVKGVFHTGGGSLGPDFDPLAVFSLPQPTPERWDNLIASLPDVLAPVSVPQPLEIDLPNRQVKVFLPGFDKKQVKLTQYGPEVTIEAGDQRRNIDLPPGLRGQAVTGAKFQQGYLVISFA
jgi:arsenite-transporting ATPase